MGPAMSVDVRLAVHRCVRTLRALGSLWLVVGHHRGRRLSSWSSAVVEAMFFRMSLAHYVHVPVNGELLYFLEAGHDSGDPLRR